jgi:hypothetical protein
VHRRGLIAAIAGLVAATGSVARAQPGAAPVTPPEPEPEPEPDPAPTVEARADPEPAATPDDDLAARQELGLRVGLRMGGRTTPGGLHVGGVLLYRLSEELWSESTAGFTFGGGEAACFRDRADDVVCDHGMLDGTGIAVATGLRWFVRGRQGFAPYLHGTIGGEYVSFGDDDLRGVAVPVTAGAGARVRVNRGTAVGAGAALELGLARFGRHVGGEPQASLSVWAAVELAME